VAEECASRIIRFQEVMREIFQEQMKHCPTIWPFLYNAIE